MFYILRLWINRSNFANDMEGREYGRGPSGGSDKEWKGFGSFMFVCVMKQAFDLSPDLYRERLDLGLLILAHWGQRRHGCELGVKV